MSGRPVVGLAPKDHGSSGRPVVGLAPKPGQKQKGGSGGGFFKRLGSDLLNAAENSPEGLYQFGKAPIHDLTHPGDTHTFDLAAKSAKQIGSDLRHPLRHPGNTLLDVLPIAGSVAKIGEAGALAKSGASAGEVVKAATVGLKPGTRVLKVNGLEVRGHYSRSAGSRVVQKGVDKALQKGATLSGSKARVVVGTRAENALHRRAAKWQQRNERVADATARAAGTRVAALGAKLRPDELRAIRLVAEETPVERRLGAQEMRKARATGKEVARHQERIDLTKAAMEHLTSDAEGRPVFKPQATKLRKAYEAVRAASTDRESVLKNLGLMDEAAQQAAKVKVARVAAGATVAKDGTVVGAENVKASHGSVFIGNPVERTKLRGKPKVSSTGTYGHTQKPSSLKTSTGGSVEHALERNDVTQIVAERHHEAVRLAKIHRTAQNLAKAGEKTPRRADDVWVWTDKTVSSERIPKEVRKYLDDPEQIKALPAADQVSITEKLKAAVMETHNWQADAESRGKFEKLAKKGKGVFVPRRLMGELAKTDYAGATTGVGHTVDTINNAQKAALVYAKLNYPVVQAVSNTAMNLIQGVFSPVNLSKSLEIDRAIGEHTAVVDDIMGQGAVLQAAFEGRGVVARGTQKLAHVMSSKVDTPARRAAFYREAIKAGFDTPEKFIQLLEDDANVGDLAEVAQRAKEAIVDYGDLGPLERKYIRKAIFVYPWQKGATKYAGHFLRDHPVQAAALGVLGEQGAQDNADKLGAVPTYLRGAFDVGGGLVNPSGVNFFQTPGQIGEAAVGLATGNPEQRGAGIGFLAPAFGIPAGLLSGHDDIGRPLTSNVLGNIRDLSYGGTAAAGLARVAGGQYDLVRKALGQRGSASKTFPGKNDALYRFLLGGLYPRKYDKGALNRGAALQKTGR